jgi:hypothetical protein
MDATLDFPDHFHCHAIGHTMARKVIGGHSSV